MTSPFVLILVWHMGFSLGATGIDMPSHLACEQAIKQIQEKSPVDFSYSFCLKREDN